MGDRILNLIFRRISSLRALILISTGSGDIGGSLRRKPKILENALSGAIGMKLGGKNKHASKIRDWHNQTGSVLFGGVGGGGVIRKNWKKLGICNL